MRIMRLMRTLPPAPLAADESAKEVRASLGRSSLHALQQRVLYGPNRLRKYSVF